MFPSYLETEKSRSLVFGDQKMQFTTVRSKEKDNDIYLKSEKLVHSNQEHEKKVSQLFGSAKHWFLLSIHVEFAAGSNHSRCAYVTTTQEIN